MKKKITLAGFLLAIAFFGCNKKLNLLPTDSIPPDKAFTSVTDLQKGLEGAYELNTGALNAVYIGSILADEVKTAGANGGAGQLGFKWQYTSDDANSETEFLSDFAAYYSMIDAINKELAVIDNVPVKNDNETTQKKRIRAELIALRGIAHFEVLIRFMSGGYDPNSMGVPIMLTSDLLGQPARARTGDVIAQVRTDLAAGMAETAIPDSPNDVTALNHAAIAAYEARVSLLTRSWDSVIAYAALSLRLSGKTLTDTGTFSGYWADANEIETLWKFRNQAMPQSLWTKSGAAVFSPSDKLIGQFDSTHDIRFQTYIKYSVSSTNDTTILVNKYPGSTNGPQVNDLKLVRVAELYLDMAEAYAHKNNRDSAAYELNTIRRGRIQPYADTVFSDTAGVIPVILNERFKELCFEGFRFFDLKRNSLPIERYPSDVQSPLWQDLPANDFHFALPIPQHELFANKNMVQNPGY